MWWSDYWPGHWMFFGPLMMIVFMLACGAMMYFMMRGGMRRPHEERALGILKERLANGEIGRAEFEEKRKLLEA